MKKRETRLSLIQLVGITGRTNNKDEADTATAKIGPLLHKYISSNIAETIPNRKTPGITYAVYTNYESDFKGDYTYFIGEEVTSFIQIPEGLETLVIPAQDYIKFTCGPGPMPEICIKSWQKIWTMTSGDLGGERAYIADFEVYDKRARDPQSVLFDIYIGIHK